MPETSSPSGTPATPVMADIASLRVDFWLFLVMLVLALVGVALTQLDLFSTSLYWGLMVLVYAGISLVPTWAHARGAGQPVWPMVHNQFLHWVGTLLAIKIVLLFEIVGIVNRGPASDYSLLLLALSCYLAGVHFNWLFLPLGVVLAVFAVGLGYLDQLSFVALIVPAVAIALWIVFRRK